MIKLIRYKSKVCLALLLLGSVFVSLLTVARPVAGRARHGGARVDAYRRWSAFAGQSRARRVAQCRQSARAEAAALQADRQARDPLVYGGRAEPVGFVRLQAGARLRDPSRPRAAPGRWAPRGGPTPASLSAVHPPSITTLRGPTRGDRLGPGRSAAPRRGTRRRRRRDA